MRRDLVKSKLDSSSSRSGTKSKEEDENVSLASKGQQEQWKKKKDILKIKCSGVANLVTTLNSFLSRRRTRARSMI